MKRKLILALLVLFALTLPTYAQKDCPSCKEKERKAAQQKMLVMKKATFIKNLKLTEEETDQFWELYMQYDREITAVIERQHSLMEKYKDVDMLEIDEEAAKKIVEQNNKTEKELSDIKVRYYNSFLEVLPAQKVAKLTVEEKKIMRNLRKKDKQDGQSQETFQKKEQNSLQLVPKK